MKPISLFARQVILPFVVIVEDAHDIEHGALPGAGGAHDANQLAFINVDVHSLEDMEGDFTGIRLVDALEINHGFIPPLWLRRLY